MLFGDQTIPSQLNTTTNCFTNNASGAFVFNSAIYSRSWQNANNILALGHDGNHGIIESGTSAPVTPGIQGLLLNYYCGEDVGICVGSAPGKTIIGGKAYLQNQTYIGIQKPIASTSHDNAMLSVDGKIVAKSIYVSTQNWADYVFDNNYKLMSLSDLEIYINKNKHLPEIPNTNDVKTNGIDVSEMHTLLLKKVEELTLYVLEQQKQIEQLKTKVK